MKYYEYLVYFNLLLDDFVHIFLDYFADAEALMKLLQCQWNNIEVYV